MISSTKGAKFTKKSRLLKKKDFFLKPSQRLKTRHFTVVFNIKGRGRLGISISKKVLKQANKRNRIKRLLREAFRTNGQIVEKIDMHIIGDRSLEHEWKELTKQKIQEEVFERVKNFN